MSKAGLLANAGEIAIPATQSEKQAQQGPIVVRISPQQR